MATIYISTLGNDSTGDGSIGNPYRSFTPAIAAIGPVIVGGNEIIIMDSGTYGGGGSLTFDATSNTTGTAALSIIAQAGVSAIVSGAGTFMQITHSGYTAPVGGKYGYVLIDALDGVGLEITGYDTAFALVAPQSVAVADLVGLDILDNVKVSGCAISWRGSAIALEKCAMVDVQFGSENALLSDSIVGVISEASLTRVSGLIAFTNQYTKDAGGGGEITNSTFRGCTISVYAAGYEATKANVLSNTMQDCSMDFIAPAPADTWAAYAPSYEYIGSVDDMNAASLAKVGAVTTYTAASFIFESSYTLLLIAQKGTPTNNLIDSPHKVVTASGDLTFSQVVAQAEAITYTDAEQTNVSQFTIAGQTLYTFEEQTIQPEGLTQIAIVGGQSIKLVPTCDKRNVACVRFKNQFGVWEYVLLDGLEDISPKATDAEYSEFEGGYFEYEKRTREELQYQTIVPASAKGLADAMRRTGNAWLARSWQFSDFTGTIESVAGVDGTLAANDRLYRYYFDSKIDAETFRRRFEQGARVMFELEADPFTLGAMWGTVVEVGDQYALLKFTTTSTNSGVSTLDAWATAGSRLRAVAFDAWELCTIENAQSYTRADGYMELDLRLRTNPSESRSF